MTEPTHHLRPDVAAQLDILLAGIMANVGLDDLDAARRVIRHALAVAWDSGEREGWRGSVESREPALNPYDQTDIS